MTEVTEAYGTLLDSVGRAKHSLRAMHEPGAALVTVHGTCPIADCRALNVVQVHADTRSVRCSQCGTSFDV
jgi:ribosomal protein S27E